MILLFYLFPSSLAFVESVLLMSAAILVESSCLLMLLEWSGNISSQILLKLSQSAA